jgi:shikimate dehydrogenase
MRKYGLIGYPLGHSFSKKYFTEKFLTEGIKGCLYENYPLKSLDLLSELIASEKELCGLNVTIPYKSEVFRFLNVIDKEALEIGAVNVIRIIRDNDKVKLYGFNSDVIGIEDTLRPFIQDNVGEALVLGTGGSSRAVRYVLGKFGLKVNIVSREKKEGILSYNDIDREILDRCRLIVNTTPLGMFPDTAGKPDINYKALTRTHILFDLVYNPEMTSFLKMGAKQGCMIVSGIKMLHSQAEGAWKIWNDPGVLTM